MKVPATREKGKNIRYPYYPFEDSKQETEQEFLQRNVVSPKERYVSPRGRSMNDLAKRKMPPRFVVPPTISPVQEWHVVQHKKSPQKLIRTQKRRMQRQRAMEKRQLPKEILQGKPKEAENLKEKVMPSLEKTKSRGKATENVESNCNSNEETYLGTILIGTNPFFLNYSTSSLTSPAFFKSKKMEESLVKVKQKQPTADEGCIYKGIIIEATKESRPQKVILEKPTVEMTKTHSMSNLQEELHQRFIKGKYLKQYFSTMWKRLGITQRIRPIQQLKKAQQA